LIEKSFRLFRHLGMFQNFFFFVIYFANNISNRIVRFWLILIDHQQ